jgi:hypothetical protein
VLDFWGASQYYTKVWHPLGVGIRLYPTAFGLVMKPRSFFYTLAAVVLVLLLTSAGGAYWLAANSPLVLLQGGKRTDPAAAMFVSRQSPLMLSLLVNPDRLESFWVAEAPLAQRGRISTKLRQLRQRLLADTPLNYEQDIKPWLGDEVTLAVPTPDLDRDDTNGLQPGYLFAAAAKDPELAQASMQRFWQKQAAAGRDLVFEQYAGVQLVYSSNGAGKAEAQKSRAAGEKKPQSPASTLATAVVGDRFVLFANNPKVLRDAINNVQVSDLNLSSSSPYQQALEQLGERQIGLTVINLPQLTTWLTDDPEGLKARSASLTSYESLVAELELNPQGLLANTILLPAAEAKLNPAQPALSSPVEALQFIPATSSFVAAGKDLQQLGAQLESALSDYKPLADLVQRPLDKLQQQWKVNLPEAVFSWIQGEYAVGLVSSSRPQSGWVFVTEKSAETTAGIEQLDAIAQQQGISIGSLKVGDQSVSAWTKLSTTTAAGAKNKLASTSLQAEVQGVRTTVGNYEILATSLEALEQALQAGNRSLPNRSSSDTLSESSSAISSLAASPNFQRAVAALEANNNGYLYLDATAVRRLIERFSVKQSTNQLAPLLDNLQSLTVSSYGQTINGQRGAVFLQLKENS